MYISRVLCHMSYPDIKQALKDIYPLLDECGVILIRDTIHEEETTVTINKVMIERTKEDMHDLINGTDYYIQFE